MEINAKQSAKLDVLAGILQARLNRQIIGKRPIEERWLEDVRQYHGRYSHKMEAILKTQQDQVGTSNIFVNLTRPKTDAGIARVQDFLFPTDDRNWEMKPTPVPDIDMSLEELKQRTKNMQTEIDDQLTEERYAIKGREIIRDSGLIGTGIVKGPITVGRTRKRWRQLQGGVSELEMVRDRRPGVSVVSPWDFFPDITAANVREAEFFFERKMMVDKTIADLAKHPGYMKTQLRRVLENEKEANKGHFSSNIDIKQRLREISGIYTHDDDNKTELWSYMGPIDKEIFESLEIDLAGYDPMSPIIAVVEFIGSTVVKLEPIELETEEMIYSAFSWVRNEGSIFGYGIPYIMRAQQEIINKIWRAKLDNAALSVGPQVVIDDNMVHPADGIWALTPRKLWRKLEGVQVKSIRDAFAVFDIQNYQPQLNEIFHTAKDLLDDETAIPKAAEGSFTDAPETSSATSQLLNNGNILTKRTIMSFDDDVTKPLIGRFYHYNMQYSRKEEIKGDMEVVARGASALMEKESQMQALISIMEYGRDPIYGEYVKHPELFRRLVESRRLPADEIILTDEEIEAKQANAQPEPSIDEIKLQMEARMHQEELEQKTAVAQMELASKAQDREIEMMRLSQEGQIELEKIRADVGTAAMKSQTAAQTQLAKTIADKNIKEKEMRLKVYHGSGI